MLIKQQKKDNESFTASYWIDENQCIFNCVVFFIQFL